MNDLSHSDIEKAWEEISRMRESTRFSEEDKEKYKCKCRFEKNEKKLSPPQNGNYFNKSLVDEDKLLVLALILILSRNCDDKLLMMALLYIIM